MSLLALLAVNLVGSDSHADLNDNTSQRVTLLGEFKVDDGQWQPLTVEQFLNEMYIGSMNELYRTALQENGVSMFIGFLILALGIFELIAAILLVIMRLSEAYRVFCSGGLAIYGWGLPTTPNGCEAVFSCSF